MTATPQVAGSSIRRSTFARRLPNMQPGDEDLDAEVVDGWLRSEVVAGYDALKADPSRAIPVEDVRAEFEAKWNGWGHRRDDMP